MNKGTNGFVEYGDPVVSNQFLLLPWTMDESVTLMHHVVNFLFKYFNIEIFPLETQRETFDALGFQTYCFWVSAETEATIFDQHQQIFAQVVGHNGRHPPKIPQMATDFVCTEHFDLVGAKVFYNNFRRLQRSSCSKFDLFKL